MLVEICTYKINRMIHQITHIILINNQNVNNIVTKPTKPISNLTTNN